MSARLWHTDILKPAFNNDTLYHDQLHKFFKVFAGVNTVSRESLIKLIFYLPGMPMYKNPFEKGQLIIQFLVNFPSNIPPEVIPALENCLPARPVVSVVIFKTYVYPVSKVSYHIICS